jgi:hypothetical protein
MSQNRDGVEAFRLGMPGNVQMELPVEGYPISDEAVTGWFLQRYGRLPGAPEVGWIMDAMAQRETTPPIDGPLPESVITSNPATGSRNAPGSARKRMLLVGAGLLAGFGALGLLVGGGAWIRHRDDEGRAVRPQAAMLDQKATTPSEAQAAPAMIPAPGVGKADVPSERPARPLTAQSDGASQPEPPAVAAAPTGNSQSALPEAAPRAPTQTPAAKPVLTGQQAVTAQPGMLQGLLAPFEEPGERQAGQPTPSAAPPVGPDKIIRVQQALQSRGLYRGPIDGLIGPKTEAALRAFQRTAGLAENGRIDTATLGRLLGGAA